MDIKSKKVHSGDDPGLAWGPDQLTPTATRPWKVPSMPYSVAVDDSVKEKIAGWRLSSFVNTAILRGFDDLGTSPVRRLVRVRSPQDALQFDLVIEDPTPPPRDYYFVFSVLYHADEETLHVVGGDFIFQDHMD